MARTKTGPLPIASVRGLAAGLAEALASIHAAGVVHRDLKPSNVLLAADGPRVIDFGIAKAVDASLMTRTGFTVGTPGFMSPEQLTGGQVGPASDVFSLGAVLAFAANGVGPFGHGNSRALDYRVSRRRSPLASGRRRSGRGQSAPEHARADAGGRSRRPGRGSYRFAP